MLFQDWVISEVSVKADLKTSFLCWSLAAREWQNTLFVVKSTLSAEKMLDSNQYRNYEVRAYLSLFMCVHQCIVCFSYKQRRTRTAVALSNKHVNV